MKVLGLFFFAACLLGCGQEAEKSGESNRVVTLLFQSGPDSLDPSQAKSQRARFILGALVGATLMERNREDQLIPILAAETPERIDRGWRIRLRPQACWPGGEPLKSMDFCRGFDLAQSGQAGGLLSSAWVGMTGYRIESDQVFEVETHDPGLAGFEQIVTELMAVPPHWQPGEPLEEGLGPFQVTSSDLSQMRLLRRETWWADEIEELRGRFQIAGLELRFEADQLRSQALLKSGAVDIAAVDPREASRFQEPRFQTMSFDSGAFSFVGFNCRSGPCAERELRRILAASAPRDLAQLRPDELRPYERFFAQGLPTENSSGRLKKSIQGFMSAHKDSGDEGPLKLRLLRPAGTIPWCDSFLLQWQERLAQVNVVLSVESLELKALMERLVSADFDLFVLIWRSPSRLDSLRDLLHSSQVGELGRNFSGFEDELLDQLLESAESAPELALWQESRDRIADRLDEFCPISPLFRHRLSVVLRADRVALDTAQTGPYWPSLRSK